MKRKRKIFYFLKTKEEYDYALKNNLIPKRGIVLIESTQEIYRNKIPYSGYSPLKEQFDSIKAEYKQQIESKYNEIQSTVKQLNSSLKESYNEDISKFRTKITEFGNKLSDLESRISNISIDLQRIDSSLSDLIVQVDTKILVDSSENMINLT